MTTRTVAAVAVSTAALALFFAKAGGQAKKPSPVVVPAYTSGWRSAVGSLMAEKWLSFGVHRVFAAPKGATVYAGLCDNGVFASSDCGATWSRLGDPSQCRARLHQITFDPDNPDSFWVTFIYGSDIYHTKDGGKTLETLRPGGGETISVDFSDPDRRTLVTAGHERNDTVSLSVSSGRSWHNLAETTPPGVHFNSNPVLYGDNTVLVPGSSPRGPGIFRSTDTGRTWLQVSNLSIGMPLARLGRKPGAIYWTGPSGGFVRSLDGGKSWEFLGGPIEETPIELKDGTLVSRNKTTLMRSSDGGLVWRPFGPPFPFEPICFTYSELMHTYYISHFTKGADRTAIMKWSP